MDKKFTDQQMALILKRAAESQATASEPTHTLESIQDIARQVGIDPHLVADAARDVDGAAIGLSLSGERPDHRMVRRVERSATTIDRAAVLATIRDHMSLAGEAREVAGGFEWHAGPADNKTVVAVSPSVSGITIRIDARQHGLKWATYLGGGVAGVLAGAVSVGLWGTPGLVAGAAALAASLAGARSIWSSYARRRDARFRRLCDALAEQLEKPR
jgi:hypothetical protein